MVCTFLKSLSYNKYFCSYVLLKLYMTNSIKKPTNILCAYFLLPFMRENKYEKWSKQICLAINQHFED